MWERDGIQLYIVSYSRCWLVRFIVANLTLLGDRSHGKYVWKELWGGTAMWSTCHCGVSLLFRGFGCVLYVCVSCGRYHHKKYKVFRQLYEDQKKYACLMKM